MNSETPSKLSDAGVPNAESESSMYNLLNKGNQPCHFNVCKFSLKPLIMQSINELIDELEMSRSNIATQALEHIQNGETLLTLGKSRTVHDFLVHAARKRKFKVFITETAPL
jgi:translation initiation factor eIF-2B subunit beta